MSLESLQATIRSERTSRSRRPMVVRVDRTPAAQSIRSERDAFEADVLRRQADRDVLRVEEDMRHAGGRLLEILDYQLRIETAVTQLDRLERFVDRAGEDISDTERSLLVSLTGETGRRLANILDEVTPADTDLTSINLEHPAKSEPAIRRIRQRLTLDSNRIETTRDTLHSDLSRNTHLRRSQVHGDPDQLRGPPDDVDRVLDSVPGRLPDEDTLRTAAEQITSELFADPRGARRAQANLPRGVALLLLDSP